MGHPHVRTPRGPTVVEGDAQRSAIPVVGDDQLVGIVVGGQVSLEVGDKWGDVLGHVLFADELVGEPVLEVDDSVARRVEYILTPTWGSPVVGGDTRPG